MSMLNIKQPIITKRVNLEIRQMIKKNLQNYIKKWSKCNIDTKLSIIIAYEI